MVTSLSRPLRVQRGRRISRDVTRPAPTGGWNARDPRNQMPPTDAEELVNWFPRASNIVSRPGGLLQCNTAIVAPIRRIFEYEFGTTHKALATCDGKIIDVTTATPATLGTGYTSDQWSGAVLSGRLILANGEDNMVDFNGTTVATSGFTGLALDLATYVHVHNERVYVIEKNSQRFYYGAPGAIAGALTAFDLSLIGNFGGSLKLLCSISKDGGNGPDDFFLAIFDSGDAIIYSGTDPGDATAWAKVGQFKIGRPISRFGILNWGDDTIILTDRGYESVKVAMPVGDNARQSRMISDKIRNAVSAKINLIGVDDRWQLVAYPGGQMLIVHVPGAAESYSDQHVRNIDTGAWCRFTSLGATAWGRFGEKVYCGTSDGKILWFDGAYDDNGAAIQCNVQTAHDSFGRASVKKHHKLQRLVFETETTPDVYVSIGVDLNPVSVGQSAQFSGTNDSSYWDEVYWDDEPYWSDDRTAAQGWVKNVAHGYYTSARLLALVDGSQLAWNSITYLYEEGGNL